MSSTVFANVDQSGHAFEMKRKASFSKLTCNLSRTKDGMSDDSKGDVAAKRDKLWKLMEHYLSTDMDTIQKGVVNHVEYTLAKTRFNVDDESAYRATALSVRDRLVETFNDTNGFFFEKDFKRCYYLSLEFLIGRAMQNAMANLDLEENYEKALCDLGFRLEELYEHEHDAGLGNGGLGRLAACFLDSMATLNLPCWGYGIRYTYGIFEQKIVNGRQVEHPDYWLVNDNPWEIPRPDCTYAVRFFGDVKEYQDDKGQKRCKWTGGTVVQAVAYDHPIPGFDTYNCINLRLWRAAPAREFDLASFNSGKYLDAIAERQQAEMISAVLYPNDSAEGGKELRLKQQYFFVCATIQDALRRFKKKPNRDWRDLPKKMTIQLNDTHPTIAIPELMRILVDIEGLRWEMAWDLTRQVFNYTNHTVLPEALERWPAALIERLLPRHLRIINDINFLFLNEVRQIWGDSSKIMKMSIYEEGWEKMIRMANLAVIGSNRVNGVAAIHSDIVKRDLFPEFCEYFALKGQPDKFVNVTNGVTPRRWIHCANRPLSNLISGWLGSDSWLKDLDMLRGLSGHADDQSLVSEWTAVKMKNKRRLSQWILHHCGVEVDHEHMLFDVQVKRIHEYKRQLMNCLYLIHRYLTLKAMTPDQRSKVQPRLSMMGGKAAPGYKIAKAIIKLCSNISTLVNSDADTNKYFKVLFLPNYNVSSAQIIIPAADLNQQISTAGTEASGTSNMKFVMNGSLIIGTLDGATVEIREECGEDTVFLFGAREEQVGAIRRKACEGNYPIDARLQTVFDFIRSGNVSLGDGAAHSDFCELIDRLSVNGGGHNGDYYLVCHDFTDYVRAQEEVDKLYADHQKWHSTCIKAASNMGKFSTDRTMKEYASLIWDLEQAERPAPSQANAQHPHHHQPTATYNAPTPIAAVTKTSAKLVEQKQAKPAEQVKPTPKPTEQAPAKPTEQAPAKPTEQVKPTVKPSTYASPSTSTDTSTATSTTASTTPEPSSKPKDTPINAAQTSNAPSQKKTDSNTKKN